MSKFDVRRSILLIALCCSSNLALGSRPPELLNLDSRVSHFAVQHRNLIDSLPDAWSNRRTYLLLLNTSTKRLFKLTLSLDLRHRSVRQLLTASTRPAGYRWMLRDSVVTVTHSGALTGRSNLLNIRVQHFKIPESTMQHAGVVLAINLYSVLNPHSGGVAGDYAGGNPKYLTGPFDLENKTVREILDRIVSQHRNGAWIVQQPPWTMGRDLGYGFWPIIEYDSTQSTYGNRIQVHGLK